MDTKWKSIQINKQNVKADIGTAILIKCPNKSKYHDYEFWNTAKLVKEYSKGFLKLIYNDSFEFKLKRFNEKREITRELIIGADELEEIFEQVDNESYLIVKEPEKIDKEIKVLDELKNDKH